MAETSIRTGETFRWAVGAKDVHYAYKSNEVLFEATRVIFVLAAV
jgi:hypothetical protein